MFDKIVVATRCKMLQMKYYAYACNLPNHNLKLFLL